MNFTNYDNKLESVFDNKLPEALYSLTKEDIDNNPVLSNDNVEQLFSTLSQLLEQFPVIPPPTFIPNQVLNKQRPTNLDKKSVSTNTDPIPKDNTDIYYRITPTTL